MSEPKITVTFSEITKPETTYTTQRPFIPKIIASLYDEMWERSLLRQEIKQEKKMMKTEVRLFNDKTGSMLTICDNGDDTITVVVTNNSQSSAATFLLKDIINFVSKVLDINLK